MSSSGLRRPTLRRGFSPPAGSTVPDEDEPDVDPGTTKRIPDAYACEDGD